MGADWRGVGVVLLVAHYCLRTTADSCCNQPKCSQSCPWNNACENGDDTSCKDKIAGPFKCWDRTKCRHYEDCTHHDAALRAGYICNSFPYYNGGYPLEELLYDVIFIHIF